MRAPSAVGAKIGVFLYVMLGLFASGGGIVQTSIV